MAVTLKVATLIIKALIKPIASQLKQSAANPGALREFFHSYGQLHNRVMVHMELRMKGHHAKKIKPLDFDAAVKMGAEGIAEGLVLTVGLSAIGAEMWRKSVADETARLKAEAAAIEKSRAREMRSLEAEGQLRQRLLALEDRLITVEDSKMASMHDKIVSEQLQHIAVTETLLQRVEELEQRLGLHASTPAGVLTAPTGTICKHLHLPQPLRQIAAADPTVAGRQATRAAQDAAEAVTAVAVAVAGGAPPDASLLTSEPPVPALTASPGSEAASAPAAKAAAPPAAPEVKRTPGVPRSLTDSAVAAPVPAVGAELLAALDAVGGAPAPAVAATLKDQ
jgi:hypothetical protein